MDSGVAAIVGAVVGAVGTGLAASATGFWSARTAKMQIAAQEAQGRRQLAFDKAREWRDSRKSAYSAFAERAQQLGREVRYVAGVWRDLWEPQTFATLGQCATKVVESTFSVEIEGSIAAVEAAQEISAYAQKFQLFAIGMTPVFLAPVSSEEADGEMRAELCRMHEEYEEALRRFFKAVWVDLGGILE
ncbi:hypothetical protein ACH4LK_22635 [Streptomyces lydicus]|uniref:hypothetical protein n=1 Tax=Streptomyces lydicus TaxID=47763 RepID=UPI0037A94B73